jgi:hypothetical protein
VTDRSSLRARTRLRPHGLRRGPTPLAGVAAVLACGVLTFALGGCGDSLQDRSIAHNTLETLLVAPYPVYWAGRSFRGLDITEATHDPSGAFSVQYGDCVEGGQSTCVPALRVVTSPDNSFVPGGSTPQRAASVRGVGTVVAQHGRTIEIPTGGVIVSVYADTPHLATTAAESVVPINEPGTPGGQLPARLRDTGFGSTPLPSQVPSPLRALR